MKLKVLADIHLYGPHSLSEGILLQPFDISLGDIFDIKWTLKKEIKKALAHQKDFSEALKAKGVVEVDGNHDLKSNLIFYVLNGVLFTHGDRVCWDAETVAKKMKASKDGVSAWKRNAFALAVKAKPFGNLSKEEIAKASALAKEHGCHTIVFGHTHVEKIIDVVFDGVRIINVPRGITEIEV